MFDRFKKELTPAKLVAGVLIGVLGTAAAGLLSNAVEHVRLEEYLWPWAPLVFLAVVALALIVDNARLRRRQPAESAGPPPVQRGFDRASVIDRPEETARVLDFVRSDELAFLSLLGPGGVGKTTVAKMALDELEGARKAFVDARPIRADAGRPAGEALAAEMAKSDLQVPLPSTVEATTAVAHALKQLSERTVIVIDNVEQVAAEAARLIDVWATQNRLVRIVVTSRFELGVAAERPVEIQPLPYETVDAAAELPAALRMFRLVARQGSRPFDLDERTTPVVARICRAVEGLPLGIELAAAMVGRGRLSLAEVEAGLKDSIGYLTSARPDPDPHESLRAVVDSSLDLLDPAARSFVLQCSVADGPLDLDAISRIVRLPSATHARIASDLVGARLLVREEDETGKSLFGQRVEVRRRCAELLEDAAGTESRFRACFAQRAEAAYDTRYGKDCIAGLDRIERDEANLRAVVRKAEDDDPVLAARVALCLAWMISVRRPGEHRLEMLRPLCAKLPGSEPALRVRMLTAISSAEYELADLMGERLEDAWRSATTAVKLAADLSDDVIAAEAHRQLVTVALRRTAASDSALAREAAGALNTAVERFAAAREFAAAAETCALGVWLPPPEQHVRKLDQARELLGSHSNQLARYQVLMAEIYVNRLRQAPDKSVPVLPELTTLADEIGSVMRRVRARYAAAVVHSDIGDQQSALEDLEWMVDQHRRSGSIAALARNLSDLASVLLRVEPRGTSEVDRAIAHLDEAVELAGERLIPREVALMRGNRGWALLLRSRPGEARRDTEVAFSYIDELLLMDAENAFVVMAVHARVLDALGEMEQARAVAERAANLGAEHDFGCDSPSPEIREHAVWLEGYRDRAPAG